MKKVRRYEETGFVEGQHEPGSRRRVLRNLLGIKRKREIEHVELREQLRATEELILGLDHRFTSDDIRRIHRIWLAPVYACGNGRVARILATLMGLQAGLPALDFSGIRGEGERNISRLFRPGSREIIDRWRSSLLS